MCFQVTLWLKILIIIELSTLLQSEQHRWSVKRKYHTFITLKLYLVCLSSKAFKEQFVIEKHCINIVVYKVSIL